MNILWCTMCLAILTTVPDVSFGFYFHPVTSRTVQIYKLGWNRFNRPTKLQSRSSDDLNSNELTTRPRTLCRSIYRVAFPVAIFSTVALLVRVLKTGAISSKPPSRTPFLYQEKHQVVSSENITAPVDREEDYSSSSSADDQPCPCISTVDGPSDQIIDDPVVDQPTAPATVDTSTIAMLDNTPPSITSNIDGSPSSTPPGDEEHVLSPDISIEDRRKQFAQEIERHGVEAGAKVANSTRHLTRVFFVVDFLSFVVYRQRMFLRSWC